MAQEQPDDSDDLFGYDPGARPLIPRPHLHGMPPSPEDSAENVHKSRPRQRSSSMFTRMVELQCKAGKTNELARLAREKLLPILRKQQGFQDMITLVSLTDPNQMRSLSFWNKREDAERYQREQFSHVAEMLRPLCEGEPVVSMFAVNTSTVHNINIGKAA
jgi:heme-degrading monooxygenase HmoA